MKKKTGKRIRCGSPAGAIFVLGVLILVVGGSFAAYTNFQSVNVSCQQEHRAIQCLVRIICH